MSDLRYPIGQFQLDDDNLSDADRNAMIARIAETPARMREAVAGLTDEQLDTPYRPDGWTVRQVVHHVPDSHMNAFVRFKLALTEQEPTIRPYDEVAWAQLGDVGATPVEVSLRLLEALHERWVTLLRSIGEEEWQRTFRHPEIGTMTLSRLLALYAWHGSHHVAHVTALRAREGWIS